jgi:hypothetical protein
MLELKGIYKWVNTGVNRTFILKDVDLSVKQVNLFQSWGHRVPEINPAEYCWYAG